MKIRGTAKSINRPLEIFGVERRSLGALLIIFAVLASGTWTAKALAFVVTCGCFVYIKRKTRKDSRVFLVWQKAWRNKASYDAFKRDIFKVEIAEVLEEE